MLVGDNEELENCKTRLALVSKGIKFVIKKKFGFTDVATRELKIQWIDCNIINDSINNNGLLHIAVHYAALS